MSILALHHSDGSEIRRYGAAAVAIILLHVALIVAAVFWYRRSVPAGVSSPAILVDLVPAPAAQQVQTQDIAPGPEMQQAGAPPPEPPKQAIAEEQLPTPQPRPILAAPPKVEPKPQPDPVKPQPARERRKTKAKKPPAPRTTGAPKAERVARPAPAPSSGTSAAAAAASYRSILASHLQRFKQYPDSARARGERGTTSLTFTVTRSGRVTSSRLVRSSGFASLDQETMALIRRAQPLPPFPAEMRGASVSFTVPFNFTMR